MKKIILSLAIALSSYCSYGQFNTLSSGHTTTLDYVGIGTNSLPSNGKLQINGAVDNISVNNSGAFRIYDGTNFAGGFGTDAWAKGGNNLDFAVYAPNNLNIYGGGQNRISILSSGNVGIGTTSPSATFEIYGNNGGTDNRNFKLTYPGGGSLTNTELAGLAHLSSELGIGWSALYAKQGSASYAAVFNGTTYFTNGNVGIGTSSPGAKLHIQADANTSGAPDNAQFYITGSSASGKRLSLAYNTSSNYGEIQAQAYSGNYSPLILNPNGGNILIGKTSQYPGVSYKLDIGGSARANEIVVNTTGADFVFDKKYTLPKLSEVKAYIEANHHLPEIPSAKEMQINGVELGQLNTKLLQKVEELTLYAIQQQAENEKLKAENKALKESQQKIEQSLETRIAALEKVLLKLTQTQ